jgi:alkylhydroperoxidase family enzyme
VSDAECWERLPESIDGSGQPLPIWARAVAVHLPRTAAAMLQVDYAHRTQSPLDPIFRAKMRWVVANTNRCEYSRQYALADLRRLGANDAVIAALTGDPADWPANDRDPLEFARLLSVAAPTIPDEFFEHLRARFGNEQVAAMVLLAAFGNYQDRFVLGLNLPIEEQGPLPPLKMTFADGAVQIAAVLPRRAQEVYVANGEDSFPTGNWGKMSYDELQVRLETQRNKDPRLPIPTWEDVKPNLPAAMAARPTRIVWSLTCLGYVPELAVPWSISTRTLWAEAQSDRIFEESLFWVQTRAIECNYCMGHCEMLLEVAGLTKDEIAHRTRLLAGDDWSAFPPAEQRAYAYARKLSRMPWGLTDGDYRTLEADLGSKEAMATFWWLCRGLYMTRVSDGFQLPLERDNVFADYGPAPPNRPESTNSQSSK